MQIGQSLVEPACRCGLALNEDPVVRAVEKVVLSGRPVASIALRSEAGCLVPREAIGRDATVSIQWVAADGVPRDEVRPLDDVVRLADAGATIRGVTAPSDVGLMWVGMAIRVQVDASNEPTAIWLVLARDHRGLARLPESDWSVPNDLKLDQSDNRTMGERLSEALGGAAVLIEAAHRRRAAFDVADRQRPEVLAAAASVTFSQAHQFVVARASLQEGTVHVIGERPMQCLCADNGAALRAHYLDQLEASPKASLIAQPGRGRHVLEVADGGELAELFQRLTAGSEPASVSQYPGLRVSLRTGVTIGKRSSSKSGGPALDLEGRSLSGRSSAKVHVRSGPRRDHQGHLPP